MLEQSQIELAKQLLPEIDWNAAGDEITLEKITELKGAALITRDIHKKEIDTVFGKTIGPVENELRALLGEEGKGKLIKEILPVLKEKYNGFNAQIEALKTEGGKGKEEILSELNQYKSLAEKQEAELKAAIERAKELEEGAEKKFEQLQINHSVSSMYNTLPWTDDADVYVKEGIWKREIEGKVQFKKEGEKILVYDVEGNIVQSGTGHMTADEFFVQVAKKANRYKLNGATGTPATTTTGGANPFAKVPEKLRGATAEYMKKMEANAKRQQTK